MQGIAQYFVGKFKAFRSWFDSGPCEVDLRLVILSALNREGRQNIQALGLLFYGQEDVSIMSMVTGDIQALYRLEADGHIEKTVAEGRIWNETFYSITESGRQELTRLLEVKTLEAAERPPNEPTH